MALEKRSLNIWRMERERQVRLMESGEDSQRHSGSGGDEV
jgi:hypothetical protein